MSWGERSCVKPCRAPKGYCSFETCNVDCPDYQWDGVTKPDSMSRPRKNAEGQFTSTNNPMAQGLKPNRAQRRAQAKKSARLRHR